MTQDELKADMELQTAKLTKISTETRTLLTRIDELEAAIDNAGQNLKPEVENAWAALKTQSDVADELVPDAPEIPPAE